MRSLYEKALGLWNRYFEGPEPGLRLTELWAGTACRAFDWELQEFVGPPLETSANAYLIPRFEQLAGGIPLLTYAEASFLQFGGLYPGFQPLPMGGMSPGLWIHSRSLQAMTGQEGLQETIDFFTLRIGDKLAEDVPLCSLKTVLSTYEALIMSGRLRHVHRLRLGYAIWEDREHPGQFLLQPAWVAWGVLLENPKKEAWYDKKFGSLGESRFFESNEYGPILVNAQTGELIAPWRKDPGRAQDAPPLIQWENVSAP